MKRERDGQKMEGANRGVMSTNPGPRPLEALGADLVNRDIGWETASAALQATRPREGKDGVVWV